MSVVGLDGREASMAAHPEREHDPQPRELSVAEWEAMLDERLRRELGMTLALFRTRLAAGELDRDDPRVWSAEMLLPEADAALP